MTDLSGAVWRKSTRSGDNGGDCVEVATNVPGIVAVRDSKDQAGPALTFRPIAWCAFVSSGEYPQRQAPGPDRRGGRFDG